MAATAGHCECVVVSEPGTRTSSILQPMFDAWAKTLGIHLFPGTAYLCANRAIELPENRISLAEFERLHSADFRRHQPGYSPRLYEVLLDDSVQAWVFRWSDDDPGLGFVENLPTCAATHLLEVIAPLSIQTTFVAPEVSLDFVAV